MCPTWEHGRISSLPPHIQVLKESSRFSPPHISKSGSYLPSLLKKSLLIEKSPPAIVGVLTGRDGSSKSVRLELCQLNIKFQLKPPTAIFPILSIFLLHINESLKSAREPLSFYLNWYLNVSELMPLIIGQTTLRLSSAIWCKSGSNHPIVTSQWASRNVKTSLCALSAPISLPLTKWAV